MKTLAQLKPGESGVIKDFSDDEYSSKFLEMGILPGTAVKILYTAPFGDPICVLVGDASLSMRKREASKISLQ